MPLSFILTNIPLVALNPWAELFCSRSLAAIKEPSKPAFSAILINGILIACWTILIPAN